MTSKRRAAVMGAAALLLALTGTTPASGQTPDSGPADRRRPAVTVGLIEQTEGGFVTPEFGAAVDAMVDYFNAERKGVGGSPIRLEVCHTDDTEASAAACAQRFADDDRVHLVIESTTNPYAIADVLVPAGKALLAGGVDMRNMVRDGVFVLDPGTAGISQVLFRYAASNVGVSHLTVLHADDPAIEAARPAIEYIAATAGLTVDGFVSLPFTDDLTAPISAGIRPESDGLMFIAAPSQCAPVGDALQAIGNDLPVLVAELCLTDDIVASGDADDWYAGTQSVVSVANWGAEAVAARSILARYGAEETGGLAGLGVGFAWVARDVLGLAGAARATDASVLQALSTYSSTDVLGLDRIVCPGPGSFVAACNLSTLMVQVQDRRVNNVGGFRLADLSIFEGIFG